MFDFAAFFNILLEKSKEQNVLALKINKVLNSARQFVLVKPYTFFFWFSLLDFFGMGGGSQFA